MLKAGKSAKTLTVPVRRGWLLFSFTAMIVMALLGPIMVDTLGENNPIRQGVYLLVLGITILALRPLATPSRLLALVWPIGLALAWCWLSVTWAIDPPNALRRVFLTSMVIWIIFAAVRSLELGQILLIVRALLVGALVLNYAAILLMPDIAIHHLNEPGDKALIGDWRGIMGHKNFAGPVCAFTILFFTFDTQRIKPVIQAAIIAAAAIFLWQSGSKTSFGLILFALALGYLFQNYHAAYRGLAIFLLGVVGIVLTVVGYVYADPLKGEFTNPQSFTGRPQIWKALLDFHADHPIFGAGFGSFWNVGPKGPIYHYARDWVTTISTGHQGYLDLLAQIGIPGLALVLFAMVVWPIYQIIRGEVVAGARGALIVGIIFFCVGHNFTESSLFDRDSIVQVFFVLAVAMIVQGKAGEPGGFRIFGTGGAGTGGSGTRAIRPSQP